MKTMRTTRLLAVLAVTSSSAACYAGSFGPYEEPVYPDVVVTIEGTVTSAATGEGIPGAKVTLIKSFSGEREGQPYAIADDTGNYSLVAMLRSCGGSWHSLAVGAEGYSESVQSVRCMDARQVFAIELTPLTEEAES